jgi:hypothetical protein
MPEQLEHAPHKTRHKHQAEEIINPEPNHHGTGMAMRGRWVPSIGDLKWGGHQQTESLEQRAPMAAFT